MSKTFLRRNLLLIAIPALLVPALSIVFVARQESTWEARSKLFFGRYDVASNIVAPQAATVDPLETARSQGELAQLPSIAARTLRAAGLESSPRAVDAFLRRNRVVSGSGLLTFIVEDPDPTTAQRIATQWASVSLSARRWIDSRPIVVALQGVRARLEDLRSTGGARSPIYQSLVDKQAQLETLQSLQLANGTLVQPALKAKKHGIGPVKAVVFACIGGLALGVALALLRDAFRRDDEQPPWAGPPHRREYDRLPETVDV